MADINGFEFLWRLMGSGDQARYDQIVGWLDQGGDILSTGGSELFHTEITTGAIPLSSTTYVDMAGWTAPPITYTGQPMFLLLDVPAIQNTVANSVTSFRVVNGSEGINLGTAAAVHINTTALFKAYMYIRLPKAEYPLTVGQVLNLKVQGLVTSGTSTIQALFNNGLLGTSPVVFRGFRQ